MEDDSWSIAALRDVNGLAESIALKKSLMSSETDVPMLIPYLNDDKDTP